MDENRKKYNWPKIIGLSLITAVTLPLILMYVIPLVLISALLDGLRGYQTRRAI